MRNNVTIGERVTSQPEGRGSWRSGGSPSDCPSPSSLDADKSASPPVSPGLATLTVNVNEPEIEIVDKKPVATVVEREQVRAFKDYLERLGDRVVMVQSLVDSRTMRVVKAADASRYFPGGRRRVRGRIYKRLGRWVNCPGLLVTLTFDPKRQRRAEAWATVGLRRRVWMNRLNMWRKRHGMTKAKCLSVIEEQRQTGYPHVHIIFPYLKWLGPIAELGESWGQGSGAVDIGVVDHISPMSYLCKYITKMEGWSDIALSHLWANRTRMYSMSQDYTLPALAVCLSNT